MASTIKGKPVISATVTENRVAAWVATVEADVEDAITGEVELVLEGETFLGTVDQGGLDGGRWKGLLVGGRGGLQRVIDAASYVTPTVGTVLADIASACGERVSADVSPALLARSLDRWCRLQGHAHTAIRQLADELGVDWRIGRDGGIWLGEESWSTLEVDVVEGEYDPQLRMLELAYGPEDDRPVVRPGVTLDGRRVQRVVTTLQGEGLRQRVFFDEEKGEAGLAALIVRRIREVVFPKLAYAGFYVGRVCSQSGSEVSLAMDDALVAGKWKGLDRVPLAFGIPGMTATVPAGSRVRLFFDARNPTRPRAALFDWGAAATDVTITVSDKLRIVGDLEVTGEVTAKAGTSPVKLSTHPHATAIGPTAAPTPEPPA